MRGLACVLMFQAHCYNSWLNPDARKTALYTRSQLGATLPAPIFLFLAGTSMAMVTHKLWEKGAPRAVVARKTILRGVEIFAMGLLFRVQELALGYRWSPWTDLLRVDVLNIIGLTMMLMGILCWSTTAKAHAEASTARISSPRTRAILASLMAAAAIALATPLLWTTLRPRWLPWPFESYINGVHIYNQPQPWLFPLFPWAAFGFVGLAFGFLLFSRFAKRGEALFIAVVGMTGWATCAASLLLDTAPISLYPAPIYDYWHTSPNFFLMRCGILLVILFLVYAWCRWGWGQRGFSPMIQLGNTSLLVYWVHIEFVYGRFSILPKGQCGIGKATLGLLAIFLAMLALSVLRTRWKKRPRSAKALQKGPVPAPASAGS
jgi:Heparan-alpha-glucosaminide N-acetyltransferase, catalytic